MNGRDGSDGYAILLVDDLVHQGVIELVHLDLETQRVHVALPRGHVPGIHVLHAIDHRDVPGDANFESIIQQSPRCMFSA